MPVVEVHEAPAIVCAACAGTGTNAGGTCRACGGSGRWVPKHKRQHPWKAKASAARRRKDGGRT